jgi:predicted transcriptional regulator YdeE
MKTIVIQSPIHVIGCRVESFPLGISKAFDRLAALVSGASNRSFYGLSKMNDAGVEYIAAAEAEVHPRLSNLESHIIPEGKYFVKELTDWKENRNAIPHFFAELLSSDEVDRQAYCVEWYRTDREMLCMVKLAHN